MYLIEGTLEQQLKEMILRAAPGEAVGLIIDDNTAIELPNLDGVEGHFRVSRESIRDALSTVSNIENVAFWHSHPGGGVGPSTFDMRAKTPFIFHCVIAIVDGELIPTWY